MIGAREYRNSDLKRESGEYRAVWEDLRDERMPIGMRPPRRSDRLPCRTRQ